MRYRRRRAEAAHLLVHADGELTGDAEETADLRLAAPGSVANAGGRDVSKDANGLTGVPLRREGSGRCAHE